LSIFDPFSSFFESKSRQNPEFSALLASKSQKNAAPSDFDRKMTLSAAFFPAFSRAKSAEIAEFPQKNAKKRAIFA
jgi:hypothetical protein